MQTSFTSDPAKPFQLVKFLSWSSLVLILLSSFFLIIVIGKYSQKTVIKKEKDFALLLAENLNHQIYQRFTLPTVLGFGRVQLKQKTQYERLDQVIQSTIHSFNVLKLRIYDLNYKISYAMNKELLGRSDQTGKNVREAAQGEINFELIEKNTSIWSFLEFDMPKESYILRTTFPLRTEETLSPKHKGTLMGILQFTQDITSDYETIHYFQLLIAVVVLASSLALFMLLYFIIRRADKIIAERIQEKERLEYELHQNEKLASIGRMVASISHEIRNPLGIIQSSAELLYKKNPSKDDPSARLTKAIYDESQRLSRTVNDFLDYSRPKQPKLEDVNLTQLLKQCLQFFESEIQQKDIEMYLELPDIVEIKGDKDLLYRAFYNLLSNATQAIEGPGSIQIQWKEDKRELIIQDSGPGFDLTLQEKYLEPFYTTKDSGTGLGLAIVNNILKSHNASMQISTAPEGGGRVVITFS